MSAAELTFGGAEILTWYYEGEGVGTTALYLFGDNGAGEERDSDGFLAQVTYKFGDLKVGLNYGVSNLDLAPGELPSDLVKTNEKYTVGAYYSLTENLRRVHSQGSCFPELFFCGLLRLFCSPAQ